MKRQKELPEDTLMSFEEFIDYWKNGRLMVTAPSRVNPRYSVKKPAPFENSWADGMKDMLRIFGRLDLSSTYTPMLAPISGGIKQKVNLSDWKLLLFHFKLQLTPDQVPPILITTSRAKVAETFLGGPASEANTKSLTG